MHPDKREQLVKLLGMLGSDHNGEVVNAARMAQRLLGAEGMTWAEVLSVNSVNGKPAVDPGSWNAGYASGYSKGLRDAQDVSPYKKRLTWRQFAMELHDEYFDNLSEWEQGFVENFVERSWNNPTSKQRQVFERIAENLGINCPGA